MVDGLKALVESLRATRTARLSFTSGNGFVRVVLGEEKQGQTYPLCCLLPQVAPTSRDSGYDFDEAIIEVQVEARTSAEAARLLDDLLRELDRKPPTSSDVAVVGYERGSIGLLQEAETLWTAFCSVTLRTERPRADREAELT